MVLDLRGLGREGDCCHHRDLPMTVRREPSIGQRAVRGGGAAPSSGPERYLRVCITPRAKVSEREGWVGSSNLLLPWGAEACASSVRMGFDDRLSAVLVRRSAPR